MAGHRQKMISIGSTQAPNERFLNQHQDANRKLPDWTGRGCNHSKSNQSSRHIVKELLVCEGKVHVKILGDITREAKYWILYFREDSCRK